MYRVTAIEHVSQHVLAKPGARHGPVDMVQGARRWWSAWPAWCATTMQQRKQLPIGSAGLQGTNADMQDLSVASNRRGRGSCVTLHRQLVLPEANQEALRPLRPDTGAFH